MKKENIKNKNINKEDKGMAFASAIMCINTMMGVPQTSVQIKDYTDFYKRYFS